MLTCQCLYIYTTMTNQQKNNIYRYRFQTITFTPFAYQCVYHYAYQCAYQWHTFRQYLKPDDRTVALFAIYMHTIYVNNGCDVMKMSLVIQNKTLETNKKYNKTYNVCNDGITMYSVTHFNNMYIYIDDLVNGTYSVPCTSVQHCQWSVVQTLLLHVTTFIVDK